MAYRSTRLRREVSVQKIISIHYFQYMSDFVFPGRAMISGSWCAWTGGRSRRWRETAGLP